MRSDCNVWGGWDDEFKEELGRLPGIKFGWVEEMRGFIREPNAANRDGFATTCNSGYKTGDWHGPMIWISKRKIRPGRMDACGDEFQKGTDLMYPNAPAALGICEFTCHDNPDANWSLRIFNDYDYGFKAHFPIPSSILFRMVFNVIPEWVPGKFEVGFSFSSKRYIDMACAANGGNKNYVQYHWESGSLIGPKPDFAKGARTPPFCKFAPLSGTQTDSTALTLAAIHEAGREAGREATALSLGLKTGSSPPSPTPKPSQQPSIPPQAVATQPSSEARSISNGGPFLLQPMMPNPIARFET